MRADAFGSSVSCNSQGRKNIRRQAGREGAKRREKPLAVVARATVEVGVTRQEPAFQTSVRTSKAPRIESETQMKTACSKRWVCGLAPPACNDNRRHMNSLRWRVRRARSGSGLHRTGRLLGRWAAHNNTSKLSRRIVDLRTPRTRPLETQAQAASRQKSPNAAAFVKERERETARREASQKQILQ